MPKTAQELREEFSRSIGAVLNTMHEETQRVRAIRNPEADAQVLTRVGEEGRRGLLREQKSAKAQDAAAKALKNYLAEIEQYQKAAEHRRFQIKSRLYKVEDARLIAEALRANREELLEFMDVAKQTDSKDLARAAFVAAERKGHGDIVAAYLNDVDPEARGLYEELQEIPSEEDFQQMAENAERVIQAPTAEELVPSIAAVY